ncbi:hypothetical protein SAMN05421743_12021 [Thalassobacillus cyri]|uniref:Uncharacterized protein n=1 Tax=Thalassobacillus cyri TaxID=571932 RepID=A0A1H4H068_9BACI|nr:hypothetical protein [Thalassobacillus cyri]SEB14558.1 hypothetical protein SAMN05421743_12021 [Thalassobacillus cyri]
MKMLLYPDPSLNYCYFNVNNRLDKSLRIIWTGDIQGGTRIQDLAPNTGGTVNSRNIGRGGADTVYRARISRIRNDGTLHYINTLILYISTPPLANCGATNIFLYGCYESPSTFCFMAYSYKDDTTNQCIKKLASIHYIDWLCERQEDCPEIR